MLYKSHRGHITIIQKIYSCKLKHLTFGWCGDPASKGGTLAVKLFTRCLSLLISSLSRWSHDRTHLTFGWCGDPASKGGTLVVKLFTQRIECEKHRSNTRKVFVLHNPLPQETWTCYPGGWPSVRLGAIQHSARGVWRVSLACRSQCPKL